MVLSRSSPSQVLQFHDEAEHKHVPKTGECSDVSRAVYLDPYTVVSGNTTRKTSHVCNEHLISPANICFLQQGSGRSSLILLLNGTESSTRLSHGVHIVSIQRYFQETTEKPAAVMLVQSASMASKPL